MFCRCGHALEFPRVGPTPAHRPVVLETDLTGSSAFETAIEEAVLAEKTEAASPSGRASRLGVVVRDVAGRMDGTQLESPAERAMAKSLDAAMHVVFPVGSAGLAMGLSIFSLQPALDVHGVVSCAVIVMTALLACVGVQLVLIPAERIGRFGWRRSSRLRLRLVTAVMVAMVLLKLGEMYWLLWGLLSAPVTFVALKAMLSRGARWKPVAIVSVGTVIVASLAVLLSTQADRLVGLILG